MVVQIRQSQKTRFEPVIPDTVPIHTDPKPAVKPTTKPVVTTPTPPSKDITVEDVVDLMDFDKYDYYLILGAYKNKLLADELVKKTQPSGRSVNVYLFRRSESNELRHPLVE